MVCKALRNLLDELAMVGVPRHSSFQIPSKREPPVWYLLRWLSHSGRPDPCRKRHLPVSVW